MDPSDLFLSAELTEDQARAYLTSLGFRDAAAVDECLQRMADDLVVREALGRIAPELIAALLESPDPDAAAANLAQYVSARTGRAMLLDYLREDPRALHVMSYVMGASPHLSDILIHTPEYFHWLVSQVERSAPDRQDHEEELVSAFAAIDDPFEGLNLLRRWKRRELLRIGTRDLLRRETVQTAAAQLADVASVTVDFALAIVMQQRLETEQRERAPGAFAVIAIGPLGGREMNYGDHIDLLYVFDAPAASDREAAAVRDFFIRVGCDLTAALRDQTRDGALYQVALPPWPQTDGWLKACSLAEYAEHYRASNDVSERLALTRARPVAGDAQLGSKFLAVCQPFVYESETGVPAVALPAAEADALDAAGVLAIDALTRAFQLAHGSRQPALRHTNTLAVLEALSTAGLIPEQICRELDRAYVFLRTAEHRRQLGLNEDVQKQVEASSHRVHEIVRSVRLPPSRDALRRDPP